MTTPPQGFRHAVTLLLAGAIRRLTTLEASQFRREIDRIADELVELTRDMRASPGVGEWLAAEFSGRLEPIASAHRAAIADAAERLTSRVSQIALAPLPSRDVFVIYAPEDRLPLAGPLALTLTGSGVSVTLAEYEVASAAELEAAIPRGLAEHRAGIVLATPAFERRAGRPPAPTLRLRIARTFDDSAIRALVSWLRSPNVRNLAT